MSNSLFGYGRQLYQTGGVNVLTDTIKVCLVATSLYTVNIDGHQYWSDVPSSARITTPVALASKTCTLGALDAADTTFTSVSGSNPIGALEFFKDTGTDSTSPLLAHVDTAAGLPLTPNGGDVIVTYDNGPNKIWKV
jgi:hypothetical protein